MARTKRLLIVVLVLLLPRTGLAQILDVGTPATLDVATWNIEWFGHPSYGPPDDDRQVRNVAAILNGSGVDIWAFQEIADLARAEELLGQLTGNWDGVVATNSGDQRLAIIWNTDTVSLIESGHILEDALYEFAGRPPLQATFLVTLPGGAFEMTLIDVHMKAFGDQTSWERRSAAAALIKAHVDGSDLSEQPVLLLGDFNDELHASTWNAAASPYAIFTSDADHYDMLTWSLDADDVPTYLGGSTIDHMIATDEMGDLLVAGSVRTLDHLLSVDSFGDTTSDHLPVFASFTSSAATAAEADEQPDRTLLTAMYPNPVSNLLTLEVDAHSSTVRVRFVDALGRAWNESTLPAGRQVIDVSDLHAGVWWLVIGDGDRIDTRSFIVSRPDR